MRLRFFFFSSRRRHTRLVSDWSSDVCSSDLRDRLVEDRQPVAARAFRGRTDDRQRLGLGLDAFGGADAGELLLEEIGRASCRERGERWGGGGWWRRKRRGADEEKERGWRREEVG